MSSAAPALRRRDLPPAEAALRLGGFAALAEAAWMGSAQSSEVLDNLRLSPQAAAARPIIPRLPRLALAGLYTRQLSVAEASFVLMAAFFLSAGLGAVRQVLFNAQFGTGMEANAFYAAFRLPDTLFSLIAGGALSSAMIPVLLNTRQNQGNAAGWRLVNLVLTTLMAVFAVVTALGILFAPVFVRSVLAPGFDAPTGELTIRLTRLMLLQPLILAAGSVATAVLNSRNQFIPTALSLLGHNLAQIAGILAGRAYPELGIYGPALGVVLGAILQALVLLPVLPAAGERISPVWDLWEPRLGEIVRLLIPNGLAVGVNYAGFILDTSFASRAGESAGLAALYNAWLLVGLPIALLGQAIGQAAFPRLAAAAERRDWRGMRRSLLASLGAAVGLALPALGALVWLGRPVIAFLFERGRFDAAAGDLTYSLLVAYALALPAYVTTELVSRGLIALRDTRTPLFTNLAQTAIRLGLLAALTPRLGVQAVPLAFAVSAALETIWLTVTLFVRLRRVETSLAGGPNA